MLTHVDIYRVAHLMMCSHAGEAEQVAARWADKMLRRGDREASLTCCKIRRTIAVLRYQASASLPN